MKSKLGYIVLTLAIAQILLIFLSWLITAAAIDLPLRSLLSTEGVRWLFGSFVANQLTPLLVYFITASIAGGVFVHSKFYDALRNAFSKGRVNTELAYRERIGLRLALVEFLLAIIIMLLLTVVPHAILLSVTGQLFPSNFSVSLIPTLSFILLVMSLSYGVTSGTINSIQKLQEMLSVGLETTAKYLPIYVFGVELYMSVLYVFQVGVPT